MIFTTEDLKIVTSTEDGTKIKFVEGDVEVTGHISVDYENSPDKIILIGEDSSVEVQTDEDEKFEFKNLDIDKNLIVNIGSFHDSDSEECEGNCVSYQEMGVGTSGEEWNKLKVDGNAIITKTVTKSEDGKETKEKIYEIKFENGKSKISRDLSKLKSTDFSEKTVINYNSGDITLFIEKSEEKEKDRIIVGKGTVDIEDDTTVHIVTKAKTVELPEIPILTKTSKPEENTGTSDTPETVKTETDATKKAEEFMINSNSGKLYTPGDETPINDGDKSIAETVRDIMNDLDYNTMTDADIFAAIQQETSFNPRPGDAGASIGLVQSSVGSFKDVIGLWGKLGEGGNKKYKNLYNQYKGYSDEKLKNALDDVNVNLEVSISYFKLMEDNYGFSEKNLESKYGYTGDEKDILLLGYNGGPGAMKQVLIYTEENIGKDEWNFNDLEEFLWDEDKVWYTTKGEKIIGGASKEAEDVLGRYYDDVNTKTWIMINHVKKIKTYAGYSGYTPDEKPDWI